jgi:hypothetical protein
MNSKKPNSSIDSYSVMYYGIEITYFAPYKKLKAKLSP